MRFNVREYLHQDRQWSRQCRIGHAKYKLGLASDEREKQFWRDVLSANEDEK